MKLMKLMTVTALTVGAIVGTGVESAEAQFVQIGNSMTGGRSDALSVEYIFDLFPTAEDSNTDINVGDFESVVQNFNGAFSDEDNYSKFDQLLIGTFSNFNAIDNPDTATKSDSLTLDLTAELRESEGEIEYIISGSDLSALGIDEFGLIIVEGFVGELVGYYEDESFDWENFDFNSIPSLDSLEKRQKAVNSLDYIIDNMLLQYITSIRVSGPSSGTELGLVEIQEVCEITGFCEGSNFLPVNAQKITRITPEPETIPESDSQNSLLVLGVLGTAWGLKHRFQIK